MKKSTKLLSVILAIIMIFSSLSVMASAYGDYRNVGAEFYDSNDNPRTFLYTDEQRASIVMDLLDNLLAGFNINTTVIGIKIDLRSYNGVVDMLNHRLVGSLINSFGQLKYLEFGALKGDKHREQIGDAAALNALLQVVGDSKALFYNVLNDGKLDLGLIGNFVDLSGVNVYLADLPSLLGSLVYGLGQRQLPIGDDPALPNDAAWDALSTKPTFDSMLQSIILGLLTEPNKQERITDPSQNTLGAQALPEETVDEDGNPVTYYYCYGVDKDGALVKRGEEKDKVYLTHWNLNSALVKGATATKLQELIDFTGKTLYELLEEAIPWAYDTYGAPNLDGQLRATLMQFCGAYNATVEDEAIKAELKTKMDAYKAIQDEQDAQALSAAFAAANGDAGNYNFMYLTRNNADNTKKIDANNSDLYYVVEWGGNYEYYHVEFVEENMSAFFGLADWEYQISAWNTLVPASYTAGTSVLQHLNYIIGKILVQAVPSAQEYWDFGGNETISANLTALMKQFIKADPKKIFGKGFELPADFDSYDLEGVAVMIAKVVMGNLMPALVMPEDVASLEEVLVYGVREYCAEILPEYGEKWDQQIAAASTEDAYLDVALNMGVTIGMYYLRNLIGVGTYADNRTEVPMMGPDYTWQEILNYAIDWILETWVPRLSTNIKTHYPNAFAADATDPLAKLSAVVSTLFPTLGGLLGCKDDNYPVSAQALYNAIRPILNGEIAQIGTALQRKTDGVGHMNVCKAIVTVVTELFGGLGFDTQGDNWNSLKSLLTNAANSKTPIQALIGNYGDRAPLANLAQYLVACLAYSREIWLQDGIKVVTSFVGGFTEQMQNNGFTYTGAEAFAGAPSYTVDYSLKLNVNGVRTAFNNGAYRTGETKFDGIYQAEIVRTEVRRADGTVANTTAQSKTVSANETVALSTEIPANQVPVQPEIFTIVTVYKLRAPSGDYVDGGKELTFSKSVIVTSLVNDNLVPIVYTKIEHHEKSQSYWGKTAKYTLDMRADISVKNTYISEKQALSDVENIMISLRDYSTESASNCDAQHKTTKLYIPNYGWNRTEADGKIKVYDAEEGGNLVNLDGRVDIELNGTKVNAQDSWFKWNVNGSSLNGGLAATPNGTTEATVTDKLWVVEDGKYRDDFTEDFNVYKITTTPTLAFQYNNIYSGIAGTLGQEVGDINWDMPLNSYIILYNSYNLDNILNDVLDRAITADAYDLTTPEAQAAWTEYEAALANATLQIYGQWNAPTFKADHTTTADYTYMDGDESVTLAAGSSTFQVAGIRLNEAIEALADYVKVDASAQKEVIDPSDPASDLYPVYQAIERMDALHLNNQNHALYRWYKYYDLRSELGKLIASATPPSGVADSKLAGVPSDKIADVLAALPENMRPVAETMVVAPTAEETAAAAKALDEFVMPDYDATSASAKAGEMETNGDPAGRLLAKYGTCQYYYLQKAISDFGSVASTGYTAESYAAYTTALSAAQTALSAAQNNSITQSEIHKSRYDFLVAYNGLTLEDEGADFTALEAEYQKAITILENQSLYQATAASNLTTEEALAALLAAAGAEVNLGTEAEPELYYVGGDNTGARALAQKGKLLRSEKQGYIDWVKTLIEAALANIECTIQIVPDQTVDGNTTEVTQSLVIDGIKPGSLNSEAALRDLITTSVPQGSGYTAELAVTASAAVGFGTGTKVALTVKEVPGLVITHTVMVYGDVNGDGAVDAFDAALLDLHITGTQLAGDFATAADATGDTTVNAADYAAVANCAVGVDAINQAR